MKKPAEALPQATERTPRCKKCGNDVEPWRHTLCRACYVEEDDREVKRRVSFVMAENALWRDMVHASTGSEFAIRAKEDAFLKRVKHPQWQSLIDRRRLVRGSKPVAGRRNQSQEF